METAISGLIIAGITQVIKKSPRITTFSEGDKLAIRSFAVLLSIVATLGLAFVDGTLSTANVSDLIGSSVSTFIFSVVSYYGLIR